MNSNIQSIFQSKSMSSLDYLTLVDAGRRGDFEAFKQCASSYSRSHLAEAFSQIWDEDTNTEATTLLTAIVSSPDISSPTFTQSNCDAIVKFFESNNNSDSLEAACRFFKLGVPQSKYFLIPLIRQAADPDLLSGSRIGTVWFHREEYLSCGNPSLEQVIITTIESDGQVNIVDLSGRTALHSAVELCSVESVRLLIRLGVDVNARDRDQLTPLLAMLRKSQFRAEFALECASALIGAGANVNLADKNGWTPLHDVTSRSYPADMFKLLVQAGANVNCRSSDGTTLLILALSPDSTEVLESLVEANVDINLTNRCGQTCLHLVVRDIRYYKTACYLLNICKPNEIDEDGRTPLDIASNALSILSMRFGHTNDLMLKNQLLIALMKEKGCVHSKDLNDPLVAAVHERDVVKVTSLIDQGFKRGHDLLKYAFLHRLDEIVVILVDDDIHLNRAFNHIHLRAALHYNRLDWVQVYLHTNSNLFNREIIDLVRIQSDQILSIRLLTEAGFHIGRKGETNTDLLYDLLTVPRFTVGPSVGFEAEKAFIEAGMDMDLVNFEGDTLLNNLFISGLTGWQLLIDLGYDVTISVGDEQTILHLACEQGRDNFLDVIFKAPCFRTSYDLSHV